MINPEKPLKKGKTIQVNGLKEKKMERVKR